MSSTSPSDDPTPIQFNMSPPDTAELLDGLDRLRADRLRDRRPEATSDLIAAVEASRTIGEASDDDPTPRKSPAVPEEVLAADADRVPVDPTPSGHAAVVRRRAIRTVARGAALLALASVVYYLVSLYQVWSVGRADQLEPVDAIVVMGAAQYDGRPSPQLAARLDHVVELWPGGYAPLVVVTGGNLPGDRFTEASASAGYLVERGVPAEAILLEDEGSNSFESLDAVAELLAARDLGEVLIVTDPYHALRSREIAEEVGLTARVSSTDTSVVTGSDSLGRHLQEAAGVAVGRIIGFERLTELVD